MPEPVEWVAVCWREEPEEAALKRAWEELEAAIGGDWADGIEVVTRAIEDPRSSAWDLLEGFKR